MTASSLAGVQSEMDRAPRNEPGKKILVGLVWCVKDYEPDYKKGSKLLMDFTSGVL